MEREGTKIQPRPREKDKYMIFAVWGLIMLAFVTMSLKIITLHHLMFPSHHLMFPSRSIILARSDVGRHYLYETTSSEILELEVGDEEEETGVMDWNEVPAKMIWSRKMMMQKSLESEITSISKRNG